MKLKLLVFILLFSAFSFGQGNEDFLNIPTASSTNYLSRTWLGTDGVNWTSTLSRTDQTLTGKAICTNGSGFITSPSYSGGMGVLSFNYVRAFTGSSARSLQVWVNGVQIGSTITVSATSDAIVNYSQPVNIAGNVILEIRTTGAQIKIDDISWLSYSPCISPTTQATTFSATSITATTATVNWTRGNGSNVLVVARAASAVNADPVFSNSYSANASYGIGTEIGIGNYAVYDGTGNSVNLTGLTSGTTYHIAIYEYNFATLCYNTVELIGNFTTPVILPNVVLSDNGTQIAAANVSQNSTDNIISSFKISVTSNVATLTQAVFSLSGTYLASDIVANGFKLWYNSINDFSTATSIKTLNSTATGSGETLFFSGLSQSISIGQGFFWITTSITPTAVVNRTIQVSAISSSASLTFSAIASNTGTGTIAGLQTISPTAPNVPATFTKICTSNTSQSLSWTAPASGAFDGYLLVVREANTPHAVTSILTTTAQSLVYASAPIFGSTAVLSRVLYLGNATSATVTGLTPGISYTFAIYTYKISSAPNAIYSIAKTTTQIVSLPNVNSATATTGNSSASINWGNPNAACYDQILVVATTAPGITFAPTGNGSAYSANTVYTAPNQVVYGSSGNIVSVTGLTNGVTYYFEIFVRNGAQWSSGVEVSVTPSTTAATILKTGDLLLIAYTNKTTTSADDSFRLLSLVDINPGTKFLWANATYETGGNPAANVRTDKWFDCSSSPTGNVPYLEFTYTGSTVIPAASIFCIRTVSAGTSSTITASFPITGSTSSFTIVGKAANGTTLLSHGSVNVSTSAPDAMFLMQGNFNYSPTGSTFVGTVLSAIQDGGLWYDLTDDLTSTTGNNLRKSRKHPQLLCASIQANLSPASYQVSYNVSLPIYTTGNRPYLLGSILNYSTNWITSFGICPVNSPFIITLSDPFNRWTGNANTNWFDCNNWALLTVPDELTDVTITAPVPNNPTISYLAPISDSFLDIAKCKNLTISGSTLKIEGTTLNPTGTPFNSRLEVNENLTINGTGILDMDDSNAATADGELSLKGNWINSIGVNSFLEGNGTVKFIGSTTQVINNNVHTNTDEFYNVVLDNDFDTAGSNNLIATGNIDINPNKNVKIASNEYIQVSKNLKNDGSLTVKDSGMLYQTDDSGSDTGIISVERNANIRGLDYVYWSSPITGFNVNDIYSTLTPTSSIYKWDTTFSLNPNGGEGYWQSAAGNIMNPGKGYIVRAPNSFSNTVPQSILSIFNNGLPNNGLIPLVIKRGNMTSTTLSSYTSANGVAFTANDDNWNLVGNPYPSAISANTFLQYNAVTVPIIEGAIRIWTHGTQPVSSQNPFYATYLYNYSSNDYITYNGTATTSGPSGFGGNIGTGQGFFVLMNDGSASSANLIFNNSMRVKTNNSNSQFYKNAAVTVENQDANKSRIWLDLITPSSIERTVVGYVPNATLEKDAMYDAYTRLDANQRFYSLINQEVMCIQGRPLPFDENDQVPLGMKVISNTSNNYTIAIAVVDGLFENQNIYLEDKLLNIIHNLKEIPYSFTSSTGIYNDRFVLRYTQSALANANFDILNSNIIVVSDKNKITVRSMLENITSVKICDILGRDIANQINLNSKEIIFENVIKNQPLIVKIQLVNGEIISRKIVL